MNYSIDTERSGHAESVYREFRMDCTTEDESVEEFWVVKLWITDPDLNEFEIETYRCDPDTGEETDGFPDHTWIRDEIESLTQEAIDEVNAAQNPPHAWRDASVSTRDFL